MSCPSFITECTCKACPVHANTYEYRTYNTGPFTPRRAQPSAKTSEAMFRNMIATIDAVQEMRKGFLNETVIKIFGQALKDCGVQAGFTRTGRFLMVIAEDLMAVQDRDEEMQTFLMLGYLRKVINLVLVGFMEMWRDRIRRVDARFGRANKEEEAPGSASAEQHKKLEVAVETLRQLAERNAGTALEAYFVAFANACENVGVQPGCDWTAELVRSLQLADGVRSASAMESAFESIWNMTRFMSKLMTEFNVQMLATAIANKDIFELKLTEEKTRTETETNDSETENKENGNDTRVEDSSSESQKKMNTPASSSEDEGAFFVEYSEGVPVNAYTAKSGKSIALEEAENK